MTAATQSAPQLSDLVTLLERTWLSGEAPDDPLLASIPAALWDAALLDPLREFLVRPSKQFRARLVEVGYQLAAGAPGGCPPELGLIIEGLHAGSLIVDDIEDDSQLRRGAPCLHRSLGLPLALNAGNFLYFWAQVALSRAPLAAAVRLLAHERLVACLMRCHQGQALDLSVRVDALPQRDVPAVALSIASLKTGGLLGLASALGALAAGAEPDSVAAIAALGSAIGVGLQMLDDLSGILNPRRRAKAFEDLGHARATFVWGFLADELAPGPYEQLRRELVRVGRAGAASEALIERLRFRLGAHGARRVRAHFARALERAREPLGELPAFEELDEELIRLEHAYVEL